MTSFPPHFKLMTVSLDLNNGISSKFLKSRTLQLTKRFPSAWVESHWENMYKSVAHGFTDEFSESQLCAYYLFNYSAYPTYSPKGSLDVKFVFVFASVLKTIKK